MQPREIVAAVGGLLTIQGVLFEVILPSNFAHAFVVIGLATVAIASWPWWGPSLLREAHAAFQLWRTKRRAQAEWAAANPNVPPPAPRDETPSLPAGETILWSGSTSLLRTQPIGTVLSLLCVFGGFAAAVRLAVDPATRVSALYCALVGFAAVASLIYNWLRCYATRITVTDRRATQITGLLAKTTTEVRHRDVRNIQVRQSFLERILGAGTLAISSSAQADVEILIQGIANPSHVASLIRAHQE